MIQRRQLLKSVVGMMALIKSPSSISVSADFSYTKDVGFYYGILKHNLSDFKISDHHLYEFIKDFKRYSPVHRRIARGVDYVPFGFEILGWMFRSGTLTKKLPFIRGYLMGLEDSVVGEFLMGSDYFLNSPRAREIKYVGLYDPYRRVCQNPFANLNT